MCKKEEELELPPGEGRESGGKVAAAAAVGTYGDTLQFLLPRRAPGYSVSQQHPERYYQTLFARGLRVSQSLNPLKYYFSESRIVQLVRDLRIFSLK